MHPSEIAKCPRLPLRLALPLSRPSGLLDLDADRQRFRPAAIASAAHGGCAEIVETDGDAGMRVRGADVVGRPVPDPAIVQYECFRLGVAGRLIEDAVAAHGMPGN